MLLGAAVVVLGKGPFVKVMGSVRVRFFIGMSLGRLAMKELKELRVTATVGQPGLVSPELGMTWSLECG